VGGPLDPAATDGGQPIRGEIDHVGLKDRHVTQDAVDRGKQHLAPTAAPDVLVEDHGQVPDDALMGRARRWTRGPGWGAKPITLDAEILGGPAGEPVDRAALPAIG
jgi:hypothetical protein